MQLRQSEQSAEWTVYKYQTEHLKLKGIPLLAEQLKGYNLCQLTRTQMGIATDAKAVMIAHGILDLIDSVLSKSLPKAEAMSKAVSLLEYFVEEALILQMPSQ